MADYKQVMKNYFETPGFLQELMDNAGRPIPKENYCLLDDVDFEQDWLDIKFDQNVKNSFLFYVENPPVNQVGYYENQKIFAIKADPYIEKYAKTEEDKELYKQADVFNEIDGDTLKFNLDTVIDSNTAFEISGKTYDSFSSFAKDYSSSSLRMRLLGINAPELAHYASVPIKATQMDVSITIKKFKNIKNNDNYVLENYIRDDEEEIQFFISDSSFYEIVEQEEYNKDNLVNIIRYKVVIANDTKNMSQEYVEEGLKAKNLVIDLFNNATDMMIIVDHKALNRKPSVLPEAYNYKSIYNEDNTLKKGIAFLQKRWEELFSHKRYRYMGFNTPGIESNGRFLGAIYVKVPESNLGSDYNGASKEVWVNVAKYILYHCRDFTEALPNYTNNPKEEYHNTFVSDAFKLYSYDINGMEIIDKFNGYTDQFIIERNNLYKEITGYDVNKLKEFTFILGDCIFMVPPISIKSTTQTAHERIPLLRARGSAVKSSPKSLKLIDVELYFNEDSGINGFPVIKPLNNTGKNTVYYMNGLRSLIAMFKLTPFLPIENDYVNNTLGIDAVNLLNIQVATVPNYPKTLRATLTLQEFNYHIYMPELENNASSDTNVFSRTIHYPAMRWYYQKPLQKGNEIKDYEFNSDEYIQETYGSKVALVPMSFDNPSLEFYIPDETQLQRRLEAVMNTYPIVTQQQLTENIKEGMKNCLPILDQIQSALNDNNIISSFNDMMKKDVLTFGSEVYASNLDYTQAKMTNSATVTPVILATDDSLATKVWPQSNNARWQKAILQYDYFSQGQEEGTQIVPNIITLPYPHENYSKNMMNELCKNFSYHFSVYGDVEVQEVVTKKSEIDKVYSLRILVPLPQELRSSTYETNILLRKIATELKDSKKYLEYNSQGTLCVPIDYSMNIERYKSETGVSEYGYRPLSNMMFDYNSNGFFFLNYIKKMVENVDPESIGDETSRLQSELYNEINDTILNQDLKLKFNKYDLDNIVVESFAFSYNNTFSKLNLKAMDGYAFQYCGGQDMAIEISIVTQDEMAVAMLVELPKFSAYYARHYRLVLNCWPLRINSEFTKLFGINEVIVESVITETIENQPGVTRVTLKLFSVDRTTRSREALKKIEAENTLGSIAIGEKGKRNVRDMFYIKEAISKAELYPDLQLPTITDLEEAGFKLYKHSQVTEYIPQRIFVDPDFYFIYGQILACEVYKKSVMEALKKTDTISYQESDIYGALATTYTPEVISGKKEADTSDENIKNDAKYFQEEDKTIYQTHKLENEIAYEENKTFSLETQGVFDYITVQKEISRNISDLYKLKFILPETLAQLNTPFWDIAKEVKIAFREKQFEVLNNSDKTVVGKTMLELKNKKLEAIDSFLKDCPWRVFITLGHQVDLRKENFSSYKKLTSFTEERIKEVLNSLFNSNIYGSIYNVLTISAESNSDPVVDIKSAILNSVIAAADAYTGEMYYNSSFYSAAVDNESATKASEYNWKAKAFLSYGDAVEEDDNGSIKNSIIPYCKVKRQNGSNIFAVNLEDGMENGYAFGVFQLKKYPKSFVEKITGDKRLKDGEEYFLNNMLREYQLEQYNKHVLDINLEYILSDPGCAAIAYLQDILILYRYYLEKDILLSVYEIARLQANMQQNKISTNETLDSRNTYSYHPDETLDKIEKEIFNQFYELLSIVASIQGYDAEKREYLCSTVLKLKADEDDLKRAIKKAVSNPEEQLKKFTDNAKTKSEDSTLSEEERNRWTTLYYASTTEPDIVSLSYQVRQLLSSYNAKVAINNSAFNTVVKMINEDELKMASGRIVAMTLLLMDYNNLEEAFENKNTNELNRIVATAATPSISTEYAIYRKYLYCLMGRKIIDTASSNFPIQTADSVLRNVINEYVSVWKSNSPSHYMKDSYFDMIHNDKRGRMVRAFPTYYLMFIDEGRDIGLWHLHDNFYGMNAIAEIEVTKSRKIAADTAHIVMTNIFKNYLTNDQDTIYNMDYKSLNEIMYTIQDVYQSIFSPRVYAEKEEMQRQNTLQDLNANITSGARIHLRMGYGANAANLPIVFNGTVAEINTGEIVEIVAQGDGIELNNPLEEDNIEDVKNQQDFIISRVFEDWWNNGVTPKTLLSSLLTTKGKWLTNTIRKITKGRFFNINPYGIVHFGDPDYTEIFSNSECTQNIFEAYNEAIYVSGNETKGLETKYKTSDIPKIAVHANGKTFWDLMHISKSTCPDYICSIVPFDMRSSIFLGAGRYYAAYTYVKEINNVSGQVYIKEKRKPFQQYHFYSSYTDIIENHITTSSKDIKTNAIGYYSETRWFGNEATQKVGPLYIDYDIYPEYQKSMTVDTQLWAKGLPIVGNMFGVVSDLNKDVGDTLPGAKEIAWRMTAHALKDSVKEMYQGEIIVLADPSIKPYDRMYIQDIYENMQGECEVEAVIHSFNANTGFTSSIYADCISAIDDRYEKYNQMISRSVAYVAGSILTPVIIANIFASRFGFISKNISKKIMASGSMITKHLVNICKLIDKDPSNVVSAAMKGSSTLANAIAPGGSDAYYDVITDSYNNLGKKLVGLNQTDNIDDVISFLSANGKTLKSVDPDDLYDTFKILSTDTSISADDLLELRVQLATFSTQLQTSVGGAIDLGEEFYSSLGEVSKQLHTISETAGDSIQSLDELQDMISALDKIVDTKMLTKSDDLINLATALSASKNLIEDADTLKDVARAAKAIKTLDSVGDVAKTFKTAIPKLKSIVTGVLVLSGPAGWAVAAVRFITEATISFLIGAYACEAVERYLQNLQVLQIYPLTKNGYVMTAGIVGHKGLVVGSPTENTQGIWTNYVADIFGAAPANDLVSGIAQLFFTTDRTRKIATNLKNKNGLVDPLSSTFDIQKEMSNFNKELSKTYAKYSLKNERYLFKIDRCKTEEEIANMLPAYYVKSDSTGIITSKVGEELVPIQEDVIINEMINKRIVMLFDNIKNQTQVTGTFGGKTIQLMCNKRDNLYNIPILRPEASIVLRDICTAYCTEMGYDDQMTEDMLDIILDNSLVITSATIINDESYDGTGFCFKINMLNNNEDSVLPKVMESIDKSYNGNVDFPIVFIECDKNTNEYSVCINPVLKKES